ncbi:PQQ-like beta-propeller repeat protein [Segnochrobactrum spirostomi]|uniref:PQQ-binding-like beta-propeller repeat protein n=1 Tax=Segnochrobactrum spirostomi TaxID=2608987 RepID=A0A6A7XZW5_9HYPH|nr:PQQ-like beta-propeller repeat protein [Segnochrobactrum spirostomi]MQT11289.1 PQQ-binding-like beta-propeller repeat protein [Segnochrobactrum spirostomi]
MARKASPFVRALLLSVMALSVAGCDSLASLNPFADHKTPLPGERHDVFGAADDVNQAKAKETVASIGAPQGGGDWPDAGGPASNDSGNVAFSGSGARGWSSAVLGGTGSYGGWMSFGSGAAMRVSAKPVTGGGLVYVYTPDGKVTAISQSSGGRAWQTSVKPDKERDSAIGGGVAYDQGRVYVSTGYGSLLALDAASGKQLWTKDIESPARGAPTSAGGKVFVVSSNNVVFTVNAADGTEVWTYRGIPESAGLLAAASPAVSGNTLVVPFSSGEVMGFDVTKGQPLWSDAVTRATRTMVLSSVSDVSGSPVVSGGTVYASGVSGRTIAVDLKTGERKWEQDFGSTNTPIVSGNAVFVLDLDDRLIALDRSSGGVIWSTQLPIINTKNKRSHWSGPVLGGGRLWVVSTESQIAAVDASNGQLGATKPLPGPAYLGPIIANGSLIVVTGNGTINALR